MKYLGLLITFAFLLTLFASGQEINKRSAPSYTVTNDEATMRAIASDTADAVRGELQDDQTLAGVKTFSDSVYFSWDTQFDWNVLMNRYLTVKNVAYFQGSYCLFSGYIDVATYVEADSPSTFNSDLDVGGNLDVTGVVDVGDTLNVTGSANFDHHITLLDSTFFTDFFGTGLITNPFASIYTEVNDFLDTVYIEAPLIVTDTVNFGDQVRFTDYAIFEGNEDHKGDVYFSGSGAGFAFAEIYAYENTTATVVALVDSWYQVTVFSADGLSNYNTPSHTNDHITVGLDGIFQILVSGSIQGATVGKAYQMQVKVNNGASSLTNLSTGVTVDSSLARVPFSISGLADLNEDDTVELWVKSPSASPANVTFRFLNMTVMQVGM